MDEAGQLLKQASWRVIDQSGFNEHFHALQSFAIDDTLCASVGAGESPPVARTWVHPKTIVLGIHDSRLPHLREGVTYLNQLGYKVFVRNSGGLAVVLDPGIFNITLVFPEGKTRIEINKGYDAMWSLIKQMFADWPVSIDVGEVVGSYCPGSYDLSINGKKIAGISQRRMRNGVAVQIYLGVTGSGSERAEVIRNFYALAKGETETKFSYPTIDSAVMASLEEVGHTALSVSDVMLRVLSVLQQNCETLMTDSLTTHEWELFEPLYNRVLERNEILTTHQ